VPRPPQFSNSNRCRLGMTCVQTISTGLQMLRKPAKFSERKTLPIIE